MLEYHEANDMSDWVFNAFDPMLRLTLNPEDLKFAATQEFPAEGVDFLGIVALRAQVKEGAKVTGRTEKKRLAGEALSEGALVSLPASVHPPLPLIKSLDGRQSRAAVG